MKPQLLLLFSVLLLLLTGCASNELIEIQEKNHYSWQKFMNEEEFNQIMIGMTYMEVVKLTGGEGEKIATNTYEWPDELKMIQAYELKFENDKLVEKQIIEKKGHSTR